MARTIFGLAKIEYAPIAGDGGMGTVFTQVGKTVIGSTAITKAAATTTEILSEESDTAEFVTETGGAMTFTTSTYDIDPDNMVRLFGGTATGVAPNKVWNAPTTSPNIELSVRVTSKNGVQVDMPRVKFTPDFALNLQRETPGQLNLVGTILTPNKAGVAPLTKTLVAVG